MIPDRVPRILQDVAQLPVIRLARDHAAVGLHAHVVERGGAAFDAQFIFHRVEFTVLRRRVPDQALIVGLGLCSGQFEQRRELLLPQSGADVEAAPGVDQGIQPYGGDAQLGQKIKRIAQRLVIALQHGRVGHHVEIGGDDRLDPGDGLLPGTLAGDHPVVNGRIVRFECDLDVIQPGLDQRIDETGIGEPSPVGVDPGDLAVGFGMGDQLGQVVSQGGLPAGENDVGNTQFPGAVDDFLPIRRGQFGIIARPGIVAVGAIVVAAIGQGQVHAVGCQRPLAERLADFQFIQRAGRATSRLQDGLKLFLEALVVLSGLLPADLIAALNPADGLVLGHFFQAEIGHQRGGGVEVDDLIGVDDQRAVTIGVDAQVNPRPLIRRLAQVMVQDTRGEAGNGKRRAGSGDRGAESGERICDSRPDASPFSFFMHHSSLAIRHSFRSGAGGMIASSIIYPKLQFLPIAVVDALFASDSCVVLLR